MTCCWRCWTPTSCTAPVCLARPPSRSPPTRWRTLIGRTALPVAPQTPGLPVALEVEVNFSSSRHQNGNVMKTHGFLHQTRSRPMRPFTGTFVWMLRTLGDVHELWWTSQSCISSCYFVGRPEPGVSLALPPHNEKPNWDKNMRKSAVITQSVAPAAA